MNNEPVAYAAVATDGSESIYVASLREQAEAACREYDWMLIPLYAGPQTWQDETAAVEAAFERSGVNPPWPADESGNIGPMAEAMADEIERLKLAIRRLAEQDATLSACEGSVTVDMDGTLMPEEREAIKTVIGRFGMWVAQNSLTDDESLQLAVLTLRGLLNRLGNKE